MIAADSEDFLKMSPSVINNVPSLVERRRIGRTRRPHCPARSNCRLLRESASVYGLFRANGQAPHRCGPNDSYDASFAARLPAIKPLGRGLKMPIAPKR